MLGFGQVVGNSVQEGSTVEELHRMDLRLILATFSSDRAANVDADSGDKAKDSSFARIKPMKPSSQFYPDPC